jgi:hypothetical protein
MSSTRPKRSTSQRAQKDIRSFFAVSKQTKPSSLDKDGEVRLENGAFMVSESVKGQREQVQNGQNESDQDANSTGSVHDARESDQDQSKQEHSQSGQAQNDGSDESESENPCTKKKKYEK